MDGLKNITDKYFKLLFLSFISSLLIVGFCLVALCISYFFSKIIFPILWILKYKYFIQTHECCGSIYLPVAKKYQSNTEYLT